MSPWTPALVERCSALWRAGQLPAAAIATELGDRFSKCSVICKMHRCGIKGGRSAPPRVRGEPWRYTPRPKVPRLPRASAGVLALPRRRPVDDGVPPPSGPGVPFPPVSAGVCRFIAADPLATRDVTCCGEPVVLGTSWCPYHLARVTCAVRTSESRRAA